MLEKSDPIPFLHILQLLRFIQSSHCGQLLNLIIHLSIIYKWIIKRFP